MRQAESKSSASPETALPQAAARAVPTFIATDLLEKLIADRDAAAVDRLIVQRRGH